MNSRIAGGRAALVFLLLGGPAPALADQWVGTRLLVEGLDARAEFGAAVAASREVIAVGAHGADRGAGAVRLFHRGAGGDWILFHTLRGARGARFGFDVALDATGRELLVGAPGAGGCGAAYRVAVNAAEGKVGAPIPLTLPPDACRPGAEIGSAVGIGGGVVVVAARGTDRQTGAVYTAPIGGGFTRLPVRDVAPASELGQAVAIGERWLVVGAPSPFQGTPLPGAAYVVALADLAAGQPAEPLPLPPLDPATAFGYAVAVAADTIAVGAPLAGGEAGAVFRYRFDPEGRSWVPDAGPVATGAPRDQLGVAVGMDGALLLYGARYAASRSGARDAGAVFLEGHGPLPSPEPEAGAQFGFAAAVHGQTVVVGAFRQAGTGAAYVFEPLPAVALESIAPVSERAAAIEVKVTARNPDGSPPARDVTVHLATISPAAAARAGAPSEEPARPGFDYTPFSDDVVIPAHVGTVTQRIAILGDAVCERDETFDVELSEPRGAALGEPHRATAKILNDDAGDIALSLAPASTSEDGTPSTLTVRLTCPPKAPVTVSLAASPPRATLEPDEVRFDPKRWSEPITVAVTGVDNLRCQPAALAYSIIAQSGSTAPRYRRATFATKNRDDDHACITGALSVCAAADGTVTYEAKLSNSGTGVLEDGDATPDELLIALPPVLSVVLASATSGVATVDYAGNTVAWNGRIPPEQDVVRVTIVAALDAVPQPDETFVRTSAVIKFDRDDKGPLEVVHTGAEFRADAVGCPPSPPP